MKQSRRKAHGGHAVCQGNNRLKTVRVFVDKEAFIDLVMSLIQIATGRSSSFRPIGQPRARYHQLIDMNITACHEVLGLSFGRVEPETRLTAITGRRDPLASNAERDAALIGGRFDPSLHELYHRIPHPNWNALEGCALEPFFCERVND